MIALEMKFSMSIYKSFNVLLMHGDHYSVFYIYLGVVAANVSE